MELQSFLARHVTTLTYILWVLLGIGLIDHFFGPFLPPELVGVGLVVLWLVAAATWFGWRQKKHDETQPPRR